MPRYLSIELTDADAKLVLVSANKKQPVRLEAATRLAFPTVGRDEATTAERTELFREALKRLRTGPVASVVIVPKQASIVRNAQLPSADDAELDQMARFEAEKFINFNIERHIVSHAVSRRDALAGSHVLIAAIDEPVMNQFLAPVLAAGIEPVAADVSSVALTRAFLATHPPEKTGRPCALIHIGPLHSDITLVHDGMLVTTFSVIQGTLSLVKELQEGLGLKRSLTAEELHSLNVLEPDNFSVADAPSPSVTLEDGAETGIGRAVRAWVQKLVTNVRRTYEFAVREHKLPPVERVYISGEGAVLLGIQQVVHVNLGVEVEVFNPLAAVECAPGAIVEERDLLACYAGAWGGVLRLIDGENGDRINLLPARVLAKQEQGERRLHYMITGTLAALALVMGYLAWANRAEYRAELSHRIIDGNKQLAPLVETLQDKQKRLRIIKEKRAERASVLGILDAVSNFPGVGPLPDGKLTMTAFKYDSQSEVVFEGHAATIDDVNSFINYLLGLTSKGKKMFEKVNIKNQSPTELPGREPAVYSFQLVCELEGAGAAKSGKRSRR